MTSSWRIYSPEGNAYSPPSSDGAEEDGYIVDALDDYTDPGYIYDDGMTGDDLNQESGTSNADWDSQWNRPDINPRLLDQILKV